MNDDQSRRVVSNWSGLVQAHPARVERPRDVASLVAVVRGARGRGALRVMGSGHSFTPLIDTRGTLVSLEAFQGLEEADTRSRRVVVRAGTALRRLNRQLAERGLALENLGDIDRQTLAGAVGTGTHGTGIGLGSLSTQVTGLELVTAEGEMMACSEQREPEVFKAAQVSLGTLGIVTRLTLRVVEAFRLRYERRRERLEECLARLPERCQGNRHFEFYWFPHTETVQLKLLNTTAEPARRRPVRRLLSGLLLENAGFGLLCRACRVRPSWSPRACRVAARLATESVEVETSHRALATSRMVRFQESEYALPMERAAEAIRELKEWIAADRTPVCFPVEVRFVKGDDIFLSPCYGRDSAYIAVHAYRGMEFRRYFQAAESIFRGHGGRPHWGKLHGLEAAELASLYPMWERFQAVRRRLDPRGVFLNPYLEKLFG